MQSDKVREQLMFALPRYYTPEQFITIVRTAINKNPKLAECTGESFMVALLTSAQMGIAPNGRDGHLIPRWNSKIGERGAMECTFQADYKGLVSLIRKNENVVDVYACTVHEKDEFKIKNGLHRDLIHEIDIKSPRGEIIGVYAVIQYKDGTASWDFMAREEVENVRDRSESWKAHVSKKYDTPWKTDEGEMFKKTVIKRLLKLADLSQETMDRLAVDTTIDFPQPTAPIKTAIIPHEQKALEGGSGAGSVGGDGQPQENNQETGEGSNNAQQEASTAPAEVTQEAPKGKRLGKPQEKKEPTSEDKLIALITEKGFTVDDLLGAAVLLEIAPSKWSKSKPEERKVADLGEENILMMLDPENVEQLVEYLNQAKAAK